MRVIALVFAVLLIGAFAAHTPNRKMSSVLAQVQSLLKTNGPANKVFELLDGLEEDIRKEQAAHDALHATHQAQCDEEISFRRAEVDEAQDAFNRASSQESQCQTSLDKAEISLKTNLDDQEDVKNAIAEKDKRRVEEANLFAERTKQKKEADEAIREALKLLDELAIGKATLLQVSQAASVMIRKAVQFRQTSAFAPAIAALAQLASRDDKRYFDSDAVERVRELLLKVQDQVQAAFDAYKQAEDDAIAHYQETRRNLVKIGEDLAAEEATLRAHISEMNACIVEERAVQKEASSKRDRNAQLLDDATSLCESQFNSYEIATQARTDELRVIAQLRSIVQTRYEQLKGSAKVRADQDEFDEYVNRSEYEGDAYVKEGGKYNEAGATQAGYVRDEELERLF